MEKDQTALGRKGFLVIPIGIALAFYFQSFWSAVGVGALIGSLIANVKAMLLIGRLDSEAKINPLIKLQAKLQGVDISTNMKALFVFMQSLEGGLVMAIWTAIFAGIAILLR